VNIIKKAATILGITRFLHSSWKKRFFRSHAMRFSTFSRALHDAIAGGDDYCRNTTIGLAAQRILEEKIEGHFAEVGVYRGAMSKFLHSVAPERRLYLFDTFEGFAPQDLEPGKSDERFKDTGVDQVVRTLGDTANVIIKKGYVPLTFLGLESETFSFVLLDLDLFVPTAASIEFFYPRLGKGGYLFVHDYNNAESDWACKRAVDGFMKDKPEKLIELSDVWGTVVFRKI
jgi:O-methyltransferase